MSVNFSGIETTFANEIDHYVRVHKAENIKTPDSFEFTIKFKKDSAHNYAVDTWSLNNVAYKDSKSAHKIVNNSIL